MTATTLDARTIARLHVRWTFRFPRTATDFGAITANPIIAGGTVYAQDSSSSVYALSAEDGALRWKHTFSAPNDGPNGLTIVDGRIYTATDTTALALDAATGKLLWQRRLANRLEQFVAIAPVVDRGRVYYSAQGSRAEVAARCTRSPCGRGSSSGGHSRCPVNYQGVCKGR